MKTQRQNKAEDLLSCTSERDSQRRWDQLLRVQTGGKEAFLSAKYLPYEPTPYPVLLRLADSGLISPADHVLDYGCGKGRAAFLLAYRLGCRASGVDRSPKLIALAQQNLAAFPRPELVRFVCQSAERYAPADENVFYFFNPFSEAVLKTVLMRILQSPAGKRLLFYYPSDAYLSLLEQEPRLRPSARIDCRDLFDGNDPRETLLAYDILNA